MQLRNYPAVFHGYKLTFRAPANVDDVEKVAGKGACIEAYMTQYSYVRARDVYEKVQEKVEALTGEKREHVIEQSKKNQEKELKKYSETELKFVERMIAAGKLTEEQHQQFVNEANEELGDWSYNPTSDRKPAAQFYTVADDILLRVQNKTKSASGKEASTEGYITAFEKKLGLSFESTFGEWNRDNVARAVKAVEEAEQKRKAESLLGEE